MFARDYDIKDTTPLIFDHKFMVKVPALATYDPDIMEIQGTPSTGVRAYDEEMVNMDTIVGLSIDQMLDMYLKGYSIKLVYTEDMETIYDNIQKHLHAWRTHLTHSIHIGRAPIEDLKNLDHFATEIFRNGKHILKPNELEDLLASQLTRQGLKLTVSLDNHKMQQPMEREGMSDWLEEKERKIKGSKLDLSML